MGLRKSCISTTCFVFGNLEGSCVSTDVFETLSVMRSIFKTSDIQIPSFAPRFNEDVPWGLEDKGSIIAVYKGIIRFCTTVPTHAVLKPKPSCCNEDGSSAPSDI